MILKDTGTMQNTGNGKTVFEIYTLDCLRKFLSHTLIQFLKIPENEAICAIFTHTST
jgi:hypothetical protein